MAAEQVAKILRVRSDFSEEEISAMSDSQAWNWIYRQDQQRKEQKEQARPQICFTGFSLSERNKLEAVATDFGLEVQPSVTKSLRYLCAGPNAGPAKLTKAQAQGTPILSAEDFQKLCSAKDT